MPIRAFIGQQSFDAATLDRMDAVFLHACASLGLADVKGPAAAVVAKKVIELGRLGTRDADQLRLAVLRTFNLAR